MMRTHVFKMVLLFLFLALCHPVVFSQSGTSRIQNVYQQEMAQQQQGKEVSYGQFRNAGPVGYFPDTLPHWFFQPPVAQGNRVYAIGVSDPDLCPEDAAFQAMHRAKVMAVLLNSARVQYYRDIFTSQTSEARQRAYRQRFDTFFRLSAIANADSTHFKIVDQHLTRYNEAIILLAYDPHPKDDNALLQINASSTALYVEAHIGEAIEAQSSYNLATEISLSNTGRSIKGEFITEAKGKRSASQSVFLEQQITFPVFVYRYTNPLSEPHTRPLVSYQGLWSKYVKCLMEHLTLSTEQSSVVIKTMVQQTDPQASDIAREVASMQAGIHIVSVDFTNQQIVFDTELERIQK